MKEETRLDPRILLDTGRSPVPKCMPQQIPRTTAWIPRWERLATLTHG